MAILGNYKSKAAVSSSVTKLLDRWQLSVPQKVAILGLESDSDYYWFVDSASTLNWSPALEQRFSLVLNIHAKLKLLFSNPENIYGFMTMVNHNSPFKGKKPIELASQGIESLKA
jgi:hypothetical protein